MVWSRQVAFANLLRALRGEPVARDDWAPVLQQAEWHGVTPLLSERAGDLDDALRQQLHASAQRIAQQDLLLTAELLRVLRGLRQARVEVLAYKGPALAMAAYGDLAKRDFSDLDLLIRPAGLAAGQAVLDKLEFEPWPQFAGLTAEQQRVYLATGYHYQYRRRDGSVPLELHWNIAPHSFGIDLRIDDVFRRSTAIEIAGVQVPAPCASDHALLLCIHAAKHMWERLSLVADVAALIAQGGVDLEQLLATASELHARRMVLLGLQLAHEVFSTPLPAGIVAAIAHDACVKTLAARVVQQFPECRGAEEDRWAAHRFYFDVRERAADKLRCLYRLAFEPSLNDARLLGDSALGTRAGGWLRPLRLAANAMRQSATALRRRS
ncbi:MAG TPA: nucleotidyltransferase family protein [Terriglobales bacterium]|nr:nucleotidyltransferase family protein [Terriglobales bacterium]